MKQPVIQNFRGARALVVHGMDANGEALARTLRRLGLFVGRFDPGAGGSIPAELAQGCDIIFYDADQGIGALFGGDPLPDVPSVAVIGTEAPSRLARVVRQRSASYLLKPIRSSGVFTALFIAFNEFEVRRAEARRRETLEARVQSRRFVVKAILRLMEREGLSEEGAFKELRKEGMRRRITVEALCREIIAAEEAAVARDGIPTA
ncbi:ANTAR domain-containing protein (plasmid) [Geminicoccaceae bacterium 1502E]|nr:ANTAR domain-containing protein [Geminicoccaceae bacterium 1502E]